uniref:TLC domain containing 1 n=1 Tax=Strigops habroptila TaxID=2489341 RepID=A0A672UTV6_STRHB
MGPGWRAPSAALVAGSVAIFAGFRRVALALPRPAAVRSRPGRAWRWLNLLVSFAHSVLAGLWALFSLWHAPELLSNIQDGYSVSGHLLVCFSSGYFIHDTLDIIFNHQSRSSWEYLVHHAMAISAFVSLIITGRFLVAAVLLLLVEVSNIFLTIRMLLKMSNVPSPVLYEANKRALRGEMWMGLLRGPGLCLHLLCCLKALPCWTSPTASPHRRDATETRGTADGEAAQAGFHVGSWRARGGCVPQLMA